MKLFRKADKPLSHQEIVAWLRALRGSPYNPASGFDVTAVFRVKYNDCDTYYFAGVNIEYPHLRLGTHAEEGCIAAMATAFGKKAEIVEGFLMGAPHNLKPGEDHFLANNNVACCGKCRQQIVGLVANPDVVIHSFTLNGAHKQMTVGEFLPNAFSYKDFDPDAISAMKQPGKALDETAIRSKLIRENTQLADNEVFAWLKDLESLDYSTKTSQAVVLQLKNGNYVAGVKIEEAAYVSIDPIQSAIAIAHAHFPRVEVEKIWSYTYDRNLKATAASTPSNTALPGFNLHKESTERGLIAGSPEKSMLTLSAVQCVAQFAVSDNIDIDMFNTRGHKASIKLNNSAQLILRFPKAPTSESIRPSPAMC